MLCGMTRHVTDLRLRGSRELIVPSEIQLFELSVDEMYLVLAVQGSLVVERQEEERRALE